MLDTTSLIWLIVSLVIGVVLIFCCIYCCACKPACANYRRRVLSRRLQQDEEAIQRERDVSQAQIREKLAANAQERNEIREKYQLKTTK